MTGRPRDLVRRSGRRVQPIDRRHDFEPMADGGDAQILQIIDRQPRQHRFVNVVVAERRLVLPKAQAPQPKPDVHRCFLRPGSMLVLCDRSVDNAGPD